MSGSCATWLSWRRAWRRPNRENLTLGAHDLGATWLADERSCSRAPKVRLTSQLEMLGLPHTKGKHEMNPPWPGGWRYSVAAGVSWLVFLATIVGLAYGSRAGWASGGLAALAAVPGLIVAGQFYVAYRAVAKEDEFVRALFAKRMLVAMATAIVLATAWSAAEMIGAPHLPAWLLYPLAWGLFGALTPLIRGSKA